MFRPRYLFAFLDENQENKWHIINRKFILCTNIPGARDCVIDGVNGFLLDTNNIKNDLFFALQNLDVFVKSRYREVYKISQNLSERYDVKRVISQYLEFI